MSNDQITVWIAAETKRLEDLEKKLTRDATEAEMRLQNILTAREQVRGALAQMQALGAQIQVTEHANDSVG